MLTSDNSYQIFNFDNQKIRTHLENNKVYFCATDICNVLEYKNRLLDFEENLDYISLHKIMTRENKKNIYFVKNILTFIY